jgi:hypothetical protein
MLFSYNRRVDSSNIHTDLQGNPNNQNNLGEKKIRVLTLPDFQPSYIFAVIKNHGMSMKINRKEQNSNKISYLQSKDF